MSLIATLRAASGLVSDFTTSTGLGESADATAAKLKDGIDSTYGYCAWISDGFATDSGYYRNEWTIDAMPSPPSGTVLVVEKVTVKLRAARTVYGGTVTLNIQPRINGTNRGTLASIAASMANYSTDFATDPDDAQPWTAAKLAAKKFGWNEEPSGGSVDAESEVRTAEMWVEVYGSYQTAVDGAAAAWIAGGVGHTMGVGPAEANMNATGVGMVMMLAGVSSLFGCDILAPGLPIPDSYSPADTVTVNPVVIRASSPAALGDGSVEDTGVRDGPDSSPAPVFSAIKATAMEDAPADLPPIVGLKFYANGFWTKSVGVNLGEVATAMSMQWTTPQGTASATAIPHPETVPPHSGWQPSFLAGTFNRATWRTIVTGLIETRPDGQPWTLADVNALTNVGPIITMGNEFEDPMLNAVTEVWVEVWASIGQGAGVPITRRLAIGPDSDAQALDTLRLTGQIGSVRKALKTRTSPLVYPR